MHKTIAIVSGKGGTGKTTLAVNLAYALHKIGEDVLLIDANTNTPHIGLHLGKIEHKINIHDVLANKTSFLHSINYHETGLKYVSGEINSKEKINLEKLKKYSTSAEWVLYDAGSGNDEKIMDLTDQVIIITNPQTPTITEAYKLLELAQQKQKTIAATVLNNAEKYDHSTKEVEKFLKTVCAAIIPKDEHFSKALARQEPITMLYPERKSSQVIFELAARLAQKPM